MTIRKSVYPNQVIDHCEYNRYLELINFVGWETPELIQDFIDNRMHYWIRDIYWNPSHRNKADRKRK